MLFNTFDYWLFFFVVVALFYSVPFRVGKVIVLLASYFFYSCWDVRFLILILISTVVDYTLGILLGSPGIPRKKLLLVTSLIVNLGLLGFFKYYNFFASSLAELLHLGPTSLVLRIILPVGISFYTFASVSYTIDVYSGKMKAVSNLIDYAFFVAFFPHLIAGPIIRARQFLSQVSAWRRPPGAMVQMGVVLILAGLVKKMVFADRFAAVADNYFNHLDAYPGWLPAWSGVFAFMMQVFFDFSGYTDIARGCAKLLGFEFPLNFTRPFLATNIIKFWQRWHITLTLWIRDYIFMPLTRGRKGKARLYGNLLLVMVLVGLWHGANWTFILWGVYQGALLIGCRVFQKVSAGTRLARVMSYRFFQPLNIALMFLFVTAGAALFRAGSIQQSGRIICALLGLDGIGGVDVLTMGTIVLFLIALILAVLEERRQIFERMVLAPAFVQIPAYLLIFLCLELFSVTEQSPPFIYFQF